MERFRQIMPLNSLCNEFGGFITAGEEEFYLHITVQDNANVKFKLRGCEKFYRITKPVNDTLEHHVNQSQSLEDMLSEVVNILEKQIRSNGSHKFFDCCTEYTNFFNQIQECGWENVCHMSADLDEVHLQTTDDSGRDHVLKIFIPKKFPKDEPKFECDLPDEFSYKWFSDDSLNNVYTAFKEKLNMYSHLWDNLEEIDKNTWVLEPENPRRKDCKRRIALASGVSLLIMIDPSSPTSVPTCHYLGPERVVEPFREKFNKNINLWSEYDSILHNLQQVLELEFPVPTNITKEEFSMECAICYSYLLEEAVPDISCDNPSCSQSFHHACLYEYIRMLPDVKNSFNKLFGHCPYCNKAMWCSIP